MLEKCEFSEKWGFEIHTGAKTNFLSRNYQEFDVWKKWVLWKMRFWNCEIGEKWDFKNVNFVENVKQ